MSTNSPTDTSDQINGTSGDAAGVQQLIDRLKSEGVQEGQQQAEALLIEAKKQAAAIIDAARAEADTIQRDAQQQADRLETNGKRALTLASRDTCLHLKEQLEHEFRGWIGRLVQQQIADPKFLTDLICDMANHAIEVAGGESSDSDQQQSGKLQVLVNGDQSESLDKFVKSQAEAMFRKGLDIQADRSIAHGFKVQIEGKEMEIDFTDEAVTAALMRFLAPKFRQLIGVASSEETSDV